MPARRTRARGRVYYRDSDDESDYDTANDTDEDDIGDEEEDEDNEDEEQGGGADDSGDAHDEEAEDGEDEGADAGGGPQNLRDGGLTLREAAGRDAEENIVLAPQMVDVRRSDVAEYRVDATACDLDGILAVWDGARLPFNIDEMDGPIHLVTRPWRKQLATDKTLKALGIQSEIRGLVQLCRAEPDLGLPGTLWLGVKRARPVARNMEGFDADLLRRFVTDVLWPALTDVAATERESAYMSVDSREGLCDCKSGARVPRQLLPALEARIQGQLEATTLFGEGVAFVTVYIEYGGKLNGAVASVMAKRQTTLKLHEATHLALQPACDVTAHALDNTPLLMSLRREYIEPIKGLKKYAVAGLYDLVNVQTRSVTAAKRLLEMMTSGEEDAVEESLLQEVHAAQVYVPGLCHVFQAKGRQSYPHATRPWTIAACLTAQDLRTYAMHETTRLGKKVDKALATTGVPPSLEYNIDRAFGEWITMIGQLGSPVRVEVLVRVPLREGMSKDDVAMAALDCCEMALGRIEQFASNKAAWSVVPASDIETWLRRLIHDLGAIMRSATLNRNVAAIQDGASFDILHHGQRELVAVVEAVAAATVTGGLPEGEESVANFLDLKGNLITHGYYSLSNVRTLLAAEPPDGFTMAEERKPKVVSYLRHFLQALKPTLRRAEQRASCYAAHAWWEKLQQRLTVKAAAQMVIGAFTDDVIYRVKYSLPSLRLTATVEDNAPYVPGTVRARGATGTAMLKSEHWEKQTAVRRCEKDLDVEVLAANVARLPDAHVCGVAHHAFVGLMVPYVSLEAVRASVLDILACSVAYKATGTLVPSADRPLGRVWARVVGTVERARAYRPTPILDFVTPAWQMVQAATGSHGPQQALDAMELRTPDPPLWFARIVAAVANHIPERPGFTKGRVDEISGVAAHLTFLAIRVDERMADAKNKPVATQAVQYGARMHSKKRQDKGVGLCGCRQQPLPHLVYALLVNPNKEPFSIGQWAEAALGQTPRGIPRGPLLAQEIVNNAAGVAGVAPPATIARPGPSPPVSSTAPPGDSDRPSAPQRPNADEASSASGEPSFGNTDSANAPPAGQQEQTSAVPGADDEGDELDVPLQRHTRRNRRIDESE